VIRAVWVVAFLNEVMLAITDARGGEFAVVRP
jgi:hypothetical protein